MPQTNSMNTVKPTMTPTNKVLAGTGGAAVGPALAVIVLALLEGFGLNLSSEELRTAIVAIVVALVSGLAGYLMPPSAGEVVLTTDAGPRSGRMVTEGEGAPVT